MRTRTEMRRMISAYWKKGKKNLLFSGNTVLKKTPKKKKNPWESAKKYWNRCEFSKIIKYEINIKKSVAFCNSNKQLENIMGKDCLWSTIKKMKQLQNHEMCWTYMKNKVNTIRDIKADEKTETCAMFL